MFVVPGRVRSISAVPAMLAIRRELRRWRPQVVHVHENHDPRAARADTRIPDRSHRARSAGHPGRPRSRAARTGPSGAGSGAQTGSSSTARRLSRSSRRSSTRTPNRRDPAWDDPAFASRSRARNRRACSCSAGSSSTRASRCSSRRCGSCGSGAPTCGWSWPATGEAARLVPDDPRISLIARYISESEVDPLLADASLVALPYTQASQSGVGLLAIARGVPVVVSDLGALPSSRTTGRSSPRRATRARSPRRSSATSTTEPR